MRFALMKSGTLSRITRERIGDYDQVFTRLLAEKGQQWDIHEVEHDAFPEDISIYDGIVLTGGPRSAYDDLPWIKKLIDQTRQAYEEGITLLGICLGAQVIAQALGGRVEKNPDGWDLGSVALQLNEAGRNTAPLNTGPNPLHILQTHQDIVTELPRGGRILASSKRSPVEIYTVGERVLCLQGHPELDVQSLKDLIQSRMEKGVFSRERGEEGLRSLSTPPHQDFFRGWLRAFLRNDGQQTGAAELSESISSGF